MNCFVLPAGMARKAPVVMNTAIRLTLHLMTLSDEDPDWEKEEYNIECVLCCFYAAFCGP